MKHNHRTLEEMQEILKAYSEKTRGAFLQSLKVPMPTLYPTAVFKKQLDNTFKEDQNELIGNVFRRI